MSAVTRPCREEFEALVRHSHPEGSVRHQLERRLHDDVDRFERLFEAYLPDGELRRSWCDFLHHRAAGVRWAGSKDTDMEAALTGSAKLG